MMYRLRIIFLVLAYVAIASCSSYGNSHKPLTLKKLVADKPTQNLIVMFPGINSPGTDFIDHGFTDSFKQYYPNTDILLVDTRLAYVTAGNIADRIQNEIIQPAIKAHYKNIWLLGISLGGLSILEFDKSYPKQVNGILLIAPYLGNENEIEALETITSYKEKQQWSDVNKNNLNKTVQLWRHIISLTDTQVQNPTQLFLAYGKDDRYNKTHKLLADMLDKSHVTTIDGTHAWTTWKKIWLQLLQKRIFDFKMDNQR